MSALGNLLRYLGLGGDDDAGDSRRDVEGSVMGAGLSFRGEVSGDGDFHVAGSSKATST
jgi:hypothetical protein